MRFGFFDQLPCAEGFTEQQRFRDIIAQIELGDKLGFDRAWLGELHFSRSFSILADPLMVLAAAGQRTSRIRLGTAVTLLPLHNPVKIAEEAAIGDILTDGRLELGCGRGTAPLHYSGYAIPKEESRERFDEALDFIMRRGPTKTSPSAASTSSEGAEIHAAAAARPHPPMRIAANSPDTFPFAARRKFPIFATPMINPPDKLKEGLGVYRAGLAPGKGRHRARLSRACGGSRAQAAGNASRADAVFARGGGTAAAARRRRRQELRSVPAGARPHRARDL